MIVLIPSYEPDAQLVALVGALRSADENLSIVVVNDGSSAAFDSVFEAARAAGVTVVQHPHNLGKGRALKTGFAHIAECFPGADVVCADSDGQHRIHDIIRVADALHGRDRTIVLGARGWTGSVPLKSRLGNSLTRFVFRASTGRRVGDTQTGLRAYPASMLPWLQAIDGERFEYEMSVLLDATKAGFTVEEVTIDTVYLEGNESTHFRPLVDSVRVYVPFLKFGLSSLAAFAIDIVALFAFKAMLGQLLPAVVAARLLSSTANFAINRRVVFRHTQQAPVRQSATKYFSLAVAVLIANYLILHVLHERFEMPLLPAKLFTEVGLFIAGFQVQRRFVFARRSGIR
jgi:putative flippase GtrA